MMVFDKGRALVIAIADYQEISALPPAVLNDARDVATALQDARYCGYPPGNVRMLLDHKATLNAIRAELADLASAAGPDDTAMIFFSGHGGRFASGLEQTSALIPVDSRLDDLPGTTLTEKEFSKALSAIQAARLIVVLDACHSGGAGVLKGDQATQINLGFDEKSLQRLAQGVGRVIIASSRVSEFSYVHPGARNSVFTGHLLEALTGHASTNGDGLIRVFDIFNYVTENVRRNITDQHPVFRASDVEENFPIALDRGGAKTPANASPQPSGMWRDLEQIMADLYPAGPSDQGIWERAGGDLSRLSLAGSGRANWFAALRLLKRGGGGHGINIKSLLETALEDFPYHSELTALVTAN